MNELIQIAIVEDNAAFAESMLNIIDCTDDLNCRAVFNSGESFLEQLRTDSLSEVGLILLDLHLPGKNGLVLVPTIQQELPHAHILILTQNDDYLTTLEAIRLGVAGYILKSASIAEIRNAIREVYDGGSVIDPQLSRLVLKTLSSDNQEESENMLSKRERQVLELMAMGYVKKEVAARLAISYRTVAQYTESIYKKLQVPNVAAAVASAIRKGLI